MSPDADRFNARQRPDCLPQVAHGKCGVFAARKFKVPKRETSGDIAVREAKWQVDRPDELVPAKLTHSFNSGFFWFIVNSLEFCYVKVKVSYFGLLSHLFIIRKYVNMNITLQLKKPIFINLNSYKLKHVSILLTIITI
ncbi:MAG: hypothetical protein HY973_02040 [Candidatus Kerfeldbacteria bacterium]|nr:hypothetical protein [Candidatus Kerfeldbacteria bacterium]